MSFIPMNKLKQKRSDSTVNAQMLHDDTTPLIVDTQLSSQQSSHHQQQQQSIGTAEQQYQQSVLVRLGLMTATPLARTIFIPSDQNANIADRFPRNAIKNQKYNVITFLPVVLFDQFKYFFNLYFLLVALSQLIPALQIGYLFTYFAPLAFVLFVTISKEGYDDFVRFKRDQEANSQRYWRLARTGQFESVKSDDLKVGDIIKVEKDCRCPADLILLKVSSEHASCYIRTDQMDGETDQKLRIPVGITQKLDDEQLVDGSTHGEVYAEAPHKDIYSFIGNCKVGMEQEALTVENTIWANCVVASKSILGLVIYTGSDTRAQLNTSHPSSKVGLIDLEINNLSKILCGVLVAVSILLVGLHGFINKWYIYLMRFIIILSSIVPLSLRVNIDLAKSWYSYSIMRDKQIEETVVRSSTIPEELGRIQYLMSDKTGTLTKNDMEMKKLHLGTASFSADDPSIYELLQPSGSGHPLSPSTPGHSKPYKSRDLSFRLSEFLLAMALCHNVTPVRDDNAPNSSTSDGANDAISNNRPKTQQYEASSPDEVAIVKFVDSVGIQLSDRSMTSITLQKQSQQMQYEILNLFPFTSETKRMGIIVRDEDSRITFYLKGADVVMSKLVQYNDWLDEECGNMSREGLRTLVFAKKSLSQEQYDSFQKLYEKAKLSVQDRNGNVASAIASLEKDLELIGLTGVEDKLQDDVKITLEMLRNAEIKIWMLTGDKIETATNIAISSRLVSRSQTLYCISRLNNEVEANRELDQLESQQLDTALIIDGQSLGWCLDHLEARFFQVTMMLPAVICCRCSPTQKAAITSTMKRYTKKRICAIGDGGNDVSMIQAAHCGVGIVGKEGKQASLAADFSITQFSHLGRLLFWHGRNSYKRSAKLTHFIMHRGLIIAIIQAVFSAIFYFTPIALYQNFIVVGYSTVYTMLPVFSLVLDCDVNDDVAMTYPELYKDLTKGRILNFKTFLEWLLISIYQGGAIMIFALLLFEDDFLRIVSISFTALIFNELLMVALEIERWHILMVAAEVLTLAVYLASMYFLKTEFDLQFILTWRFVWKTAVIISISCIPLYVIRVLRRYYSPPIYQKLN
ncbi:hypothetical protein MP228_005181 [Amoeboaphelidium protococcarum]|nr:hypothetical protein MP228_005181 [Amoeboaphelidium protococcarum]